MWAIFILLLFSMDDESSVTNIEMSALLEVFIRALLSIQINDPHRLGRRISRNPNKNWHHMLGFWFCDIPTQSGTYAHEWQILDELYDYDYISITKATDKSNMQLSRFPSNIPLHTTTNLIAIISTFVMMPLHIIIYSANEILRPYFNYRP